MCDRIEKDSIHRRMKMIDLDTARSIIDTKRSEIDRLNNVTLNVEHDTPFVEIEGFRELSFITHGFSTRLGGVSEGIYESMNLGIHLDDDRDKVIENYRRLTSAIGVDYKRISCPNQQHHDNILVVKEADAGDGIARNLTHSDIDAQITDVAGLPLIVYSADCVPILLADPVKKVIGSVHAGWRGSVMGIAAKTVKKMQEVYGSEPKDIRAVIGPSIGIESYEVDDTVINEVRNCGFIDFSEANVSKVAASDTFDNEYVIIRGRFTGDVPGPAYGIYRTVKEKDRFMLNLWNLNELILYNAGLKPGHIYNTKLDTYRLHDIFFSHRFTKGRRGLNAGIISII